MPGRAVQRALPVPTCGASLKARTVAVDAGVMLVLMAADDDGGSSFVVSPDFGFVIWTVVVLAYALLCFAAAVVCVAKGRMD